MMHHYVSTDSRGQADPTLQVFAFLAAIIIDNEYFVGCNLQHHHKLPQNPTNQTFRHAGYVK